MTGTDPERALSELRRLLERERAALLAGRYGDVAACVARRETLIALLMRLPRERLAGFEDEAAALKRDLARNRDLLGAARDGVQAARRRMEGAKGQAGFSVYTEDGAIERAGDGRRTLSRS
ncbi:MAG: hypothetical protein AAFQ51_04175 [Pseudomonadota bacterium]